MLGSNAEYVQASVYDQPDIFSDQFDVVVFRAVHYHLNNPFGAFEAIGRITRKDGLLCTEGEALRFYAETLEGKLRFDEALKLLADWDIPVMLFYPGNYKSGENWNVPNLACFKGWMQASGFDITKQRIWEDFEINGQRLIVSAKRNANEVAVEQSVLKKGWRNEARGQVVKGQFIQADRLDTLGKALKDE